MGGEDGRDWFAIVFHGPGGRPTGQHVSHYVVAGGRYSAAYAKLGIGLALIRYQRFEPNTAA